MPYSPSSGQKVLLLWGSYIKNDFLIESVENLKKQMGDAGSIFVENFERLILSNHASSSFDVVFCGTLTPTAKSHSSETFAEIARILKPGGTAVIRESVSTQDNMQNHRASSKLSSALKLSGFINVSQPEIIPVTEANVQDYEKNFSHHNKNIILVEVQANKPGFEVGSSIQITAAVKTESSAAKIWTLSADDAFGDNVELINEDDLLDEDDLKKPDPSSLRVCATTKKRKACKNCSCGLAEELEKEVSEKIEQNRSATSSCGSCYLGDAFRCASCPYLGMPAFKPGEKIVLSERQLKADS